MTDVLLSGWGDDGSAVYVDDEVVTHDDMADKYVAIKTPVGPITVAYFYDGNGWCARLQVPSGLEVDVREFSLDRDDE